jgi:hypothetical protein
MPLLADILLNSHKWSNAYVEAQVDKGVKTWRDPNRTLEDVGKAIAAAPKFRVMPQVFDAAIDVYEQVIDGKFELPHCQRPGLSWVEWAVEDLRCGVLLCDDDWGMVVSHKPGTSLWGTKAMKWVDGELEMEVEFSTRKGEPLPLWAITGVITSPDEIPPNDWAQMKGHGTIMSLYQIIRSMMESPRLVERQPVIQDERLQRAREKRGVARLSDHTEVVIHVTHQERQDREAAEDAIRKGRKLHHVRMFHRVRRGKVERVREHWRGDAGLGVKPKPERYRVTL